MSHPLRVLVSGSGIAGSVFASWCLRAYPLAKITIVERDPSLRLTGASVDIRSNAVDIIKHMNAEPAIRAQTTKEEGVSFVNEKGAPIATLRATGSTEYQSITSEYEIFRGALAKIFIEPIVGKVETIFNETVESYSETPEGVDVTFTNSKETKTYDLLVAADGLGSKIRGMMLGTKPREQIMDEGAHVAYFTVKSDLLQGSKLATWYNATEGRVLFIRPDPDPAGRTRGHFTKVTWKGDEKRQISEDAIREGNEAYMQFLEREFADVGYLAPQLLKAMRESDDFYCSLFAQVKSPKLQSGRVVLLGDAGYATPGFGTSLAIIGGYLLAGELLLHKGDVHTAVQKYEELMLPFVKANQGGGDIAMQCLNPQTWWGLQIRDTIMRVVTGLRLHIILPWLGAKLGFSEKKLDMPDFQWGPEGHMTVEKAKESL